MVDPILRMSGITKRFHGVTALSDVSIDVMPGEVHAICGENGAGKSTLMNVLSGVHATGSFDGSIRLDGRDVAFRSVSDSESHGIAIIHQELALVPNLTIAENIHLGNEISRRGLIDWRRTNARAAEVMERVGLDENTSSRVGDLGVGKQQLVEIAKALAKDVKLLILDEPTAALNDSDSERLLGLIEQLRAQGITCIVISHKLREVLRVADRITVIRDGRTIETMRRDDPATDEGRIIRAMVGRDLDSLFPPRDPDIGEEMFRVENWSVRHPADRERVIVDEVSLSVRAGEIIGLAGLMGAGRTELAMSIFGRSYGSHITGSAFKRGRRIELRTVEQAIGHGIAYATEDRKQYGLNLIGDIRANVSSAALSRLARAGIVDRFREHKVADAYRYKLNIKAPSVASVTGGLSGGNQQKVVLSKWMFTNPDVLILDEPTRGIDVGAKYEIYGIINELAAQGKAVIVISSELPEVIGLSDRIYTIAEGRITAEVAREDATQELLMRCMTAGL
ncbi:multiple monosaccharide ABC transporter ATP-binding protein [Microbacterium halotolerans]|uniref:multiple monosaccharide ABC transporter ATP-binding protein n=1 Tax=Microbacterium halotolerans TaxID=246613 RepID=UPI000E6AA2BE|nr:multiple monosaccharide ABC transporter ATP-binding protein [Microbacterium halotolerans]